MRYKEVYINCSCGGGASVKIPHEQKDAVSECACGKVLMSAEGSDNWRVVSEDGPTLGISVGDESKSGDVFGG